jgi:CheY-like chemotaxis protein
VIGRPAQQVALPVANTERLECRELLQVLDSLGNNRCADRVGEGDQACRERSFRRVSLDSRDERPLVGYGYTILEAGTPDEALEIASTWSGPIHLILSDVMRPGETGPQLVKKLQTLRPEAKCVFSSGYAHGQVGDRGLSPDQPFIAKPYSAVELASTIRRTLDQ